MRRISNFRHKCSQSLSVVKQTLFPLPLVIFAINIDDSAGVFADCPSRRRRMVVFENFGISGLFNR